MEDQEVGYYEHHSSLIMNAMNSTLLWITFRQFITLTAV